MLSKKGREKRGDGKSEKRSYGEKEGEKNWEK